MPQAGKKPAAKRAKGTKTAAKGAKSVAKKGAKRSTKSGAKKSAKTPPRKGSPRKGSPRRSLVTPQAYFFWVFAIPKANLRDAGVELVSATRGTPPIRQPKDGGTNLVGLQCKQPVDENRQPALQFIQSPVFDDRDRAMAYIAENAEGGPLHAASENDVMYTLIVGS